MKQAKSLAVVLFPMALTACGGGGGGGGGPMIEEPDPNALSSIGYAPNDVSGLSDGITFRQPAVTTLSVAGTGTELTETDITIRVDGVGSLDAVGTLTIDGEEFTLPFSSVGDFTDGNITLFLDTEFNGVRLARLEIGDVTDPANIGDPTQSIAHFVRGYDVDPVDVAARFGTGFFNGVLEATALQDNAGLGGERFFASVDGTVRLFADFDANVFGGRLDFADPDTSMLATNEFTLPRVQLNVVETPIEGNFFESTLELQNLNTFGPDRTLVDSSFDGRFYGLRSGSVGGTFSLTIEETGNDPILLQGGYLADDPVQTGTGRFN